MNMKRFGMVAAALALAAMLGGCSPSKVEPGEVGVIVSTAGSDKGVQMYPAKSGWNWVGPTENLYTFKTFDQNINLGEVSFGDGDGARLTANVGITAYAKPDSAPALFLKYRKDMDDILKVNGLQVLKTAFANEGSKLKVDKIYGEGQEEFLQRIKVRIAEHFEPYGLVVTNLYLLEEFGLPPSIKDGLNAKVLANQLTAQKQNEVDQAIAEADKIREKAKGDKDAEISRAEGQAEAIALIGKAMQDNPQFLELKKVETWDGKLPVYMTSGAVTPIMPLK